MGYCVPEILPEAGVSPDVLLGATTIEALTCERRQQLWVLTGVLASQSPCVGRALRVPQQPLPERSSEAALHTPEKMGPRSVLAQEDT